jgi:hypothetical protein
MGGDILGGLEDDVDVTGGFGKNGPAHASIYTGTVCILSKKLHLY